MEGRGCKDRRKRQSDTGKRDVEEAEVLSESKHATVSVSVSEKASILCHGWPDMVSPERERKERKRVERKQRIRAVFYSCGFIYFCYGVCAAEFNVFFPMNDETKEVKVLSWCDENDTKLVCMYYV